MKNTVNTLTRSNDKMRYAFKRFTKDLIAAGFIIGFVYGYKFLMDIGFIVG